MPEPIRPLALPPRPETKERLESWKEIAAYLGREVRTIQGWEKNENLPVHRHQHARSGSVYAFRSELDAWREARKGVPEPAEPLLAVRTQRTPSRKWLVPLLCGVFLIVSAIAIWVVRRTSPTGETLSSVVVLPFLDLSPQKDQEYFSDGLTEEIIDALSRVPNLRVVARTSAFAFKGKAADIRQIGQQLNVGAVLEGSVRKSGDQLRITAQLNRASDGTHLWSRTFDRQLRDIFEVQREISQAIANQLRAGQVPQRAPTIDVEAYRLYQEGRYLFNQYTPDPLHKAIERYRQAVARDPKFALAYAGMADAYAYLGENFFVAPKEVMPKAKEAAEKAVALDDNLGEGHVSLGIVKLDYEWDRAAAQAEIRKALQLNPSSSWAHHWNGHLLEAQGRLPEAMKEMRAALALDPLSMPLYWDIGGELQWAGKYDESVRHLDKALELFPNQPILMAIQAGNYFAKGDVKSMHRIIEDMKTAAAAAGIDKTSTIVTFAAWGAALEGRRAEAQRALAELEQRRKTEYVEPVVVTWLCAALHDRNGVLMWLRRGYEERSALFAYAPLNKDIYAGIPEAQALFAKALH